MELVTETVTLATPDGSMPAYRCRPAAEGSYPALVVVMEAFGLNPHIKKVAERFAREGYATIAPDLYHRFGSPIVPYGDIQTAIGYLNQLRDGPVMAEIGAVLAHLRAQPFVAEAPVGITGFCMGGRVAFLAACHYPEIRAAVPFYGGGIAADSPKAPINQAEKIACPLLLFFGETDPLIPLEQVKRIEETLGRLGKRFELKVYPGAGHGFFCDERGAYHPEAARDAWTRAVAFLEAHLKRHGAAS